MKKAAIILSSFIFSVLCIHAQNIGVGDLSPSAKLTVRGSETSLDGQAAAIKLQNTASTNAWYLRAGATGTNTPANAFSISDNSGYHFTIGQFGNIGIGINPTAAKLHINGEIRMQGTNVFEFGAGVAGKEVNAGKVGYNAFGQNALTFVGGGTNATNRAFYFYGEGGATFNGPMTIAGNTNIGGQIQVNGSTGTTGQVLTSNGASNPTWQNTSFTNSTRFAADIPLLEGSGSLGYTTIYNLTPADVTIGATSITINKSGLYHFEGNLHVYVTFSGAAPDYLSLSSSFNADGQSYDITNYSPMALDKPGSNFIYRSTLRFSNEIYITAPATVTLSRDIGYTSGFATIVSRYSRGKLTGYLISE